MSSKGRGVGNTESKVSWLVVQKVRTPQVRGERTRVAGGQDAGHLGGKGGEGSGGGGGLEEAFGGESLLHDGTDLSLQRREAGSAAGGIFALMFGVGNGGFQLGHQGLEVQPCGIKMVRRGHSQRGGWR